MSLELNDIKNAFNKAKIPISEIKATDKGYIVFVDFIYFDKLQIIHQELKDNYKIGKLAPFLIFDYLISQNKFEIKLAIEIKAI